LHDVAQEKRNWKKCRSIHRVLDQLWPFRTSLLYALLHETIHFNPRTGGGTAWSASPQGLEWPGFRWLKDIWLASAVEDQKTGGLVDQLDEIMFSGEMVYPFHFQAFEYLRPYLELANKLTKSEHWPKPYDPDQLPRNTLRSSGYEPFGPYAFPMPSSVVYVRSGEIPTTAAGFVTD
jgi:hypothetical protein